MNRPVSPNLAALILIGFAVLILAILPVSIQITPNASLAQATTTATGSGTNTMSMPTMNMAQQPQAQTVEYTLKTIIGQTPAMAFIGVGGSIDGQINPHLTANVGDTVRLTVINGDPVLHSLNIDEFGVATGDMVEKDQQVILEFIADKPGDFVYYCNIPGHRQIGMWGTLTVTGEMPAGQAVMVSNAAAVPTTAPVAPAVADAVSVVRSPADLPAPIGDRGPTNVRVDLNAIEVNGILADGTTYRYFTFDGKIPGPMIRIRVGDTVDLHIHNDTSSQMIHSIDLHAVTGPGGGAVYTQTNPGEETSFSFKALAPGVFVYHCATPSVAEHIASGMYGLIVVEPAGGLPTVDREFYVMQGEVYTVEPFGTQGNLTFDYQAMLDERPQYYVFNGAAGALTSDENALRANVGETVRIFFAVGGPNKISSFHVIGEMFDRVYDQASLTSPPLTDVQTTIVPPGGATMVEFKVEVPGRYILVDHALSRMERGLMGFLYVEGDDQPDIFHGDTVTPGSGH